MKERRTIKGHLIRLIAKLAVAGPWRGSIERLTCSIGQKFPTSRIVLSFCRHFGELLIQREGERFERVVTFASGGKMRCGGEKRIGPICLMHYFLGTITNQDEDERPLVELLCRSVRQGDTFFDIGANFGVYSFLMGPLCGKSGSIHSFEANPLLIEHLRRSAELNKPQANIVINAVAVGKEGNKTLQLYDPERIGGSSLYQLEWLNKQSSVTVPVTTIDDYCRAKKISRVDVVKIDIEGAELDAFQGMQETFKTCPPSLIVCELIPTLIAHGGGNALDVIEFLHARGYEARYIRENDGRIASLIEIEAMKQLTQNLINIAFVQPKLKEARPDLFCA